MRGRGYLVLFAIFFVVVVVINIAMYGNKKEQAERILTNQGVKVTSLGFGFFGCSEDDTYNFKFSGVNEKGNRVEGRICSGVLKGATIRYN